MIANGKIQITIHNGYDDEYLISYADEEGEVSRVVVADAVVRTTNLHDFSVFELEIIVPSEHADELLVGMVKGETDIAVGKITPVVESI